MPKNCKKKLKRKFQNWGKTKTHKIEKKKDIEQTEGSKQNCHFTWVDSMMGSMCSFTTLSQWRWRRWTAKCMKSHSYVCNCANVYVNIVWMYVYMFVCASEMCWLNGSTSSRGSNIWWVKKSIRFFENKSKDKKQFQQFYE